MATDGAHTHHMRRLNGRPPDTIVADYVGPEPQLNRGEDIFAAIARLERRCRELRADLHRVESAPLPSSHARQRMREIIGHLAQPPHVSMLIEHEDGEIVWPMQNLTAQIHNTTEPAIAFAEAASALALVAFACKEQLIERLDALIAEEADDGAASSIAARQTQGAQMAGDLLSVERDLSFWTWRGLSQGLPVWFGDINPVAILAAQLVTRPAGNGGGSSPGYGAIEIVGRDDKFAMLEPVACVPPACTA